MLIVGTFPFIFANHFGLFVSQGKGEGPIFTFQMVRLSHDLDLLTTFPWPLSIAVLILPVIKAIAFALVLPLMLLMLQGLIRGLGRESVKSPMPSTNIYESLQY